MSNSPTCPCCGGEVSPLDLLFDDAKGLVAYNGGAAKLTPKQVALFRALINVYPRALTKEAALNAISDNTDPDSWPDAKIIDVMICHLRKKLDSIGLVITTQWGIGFMLTLDEAGKAAALRQKVFLRGQRAKLVPETGDIAVVALYRAQGYPITDIARRCGLTFKATVAAIDMIEAAETQRRDAARLSPVRRVA